MIYDISLAINFLLRISVNRDVLEFRIHNFLACVDTVVAGEYVA